MKSIGNNKIMQLTLSIDALEDYLKNQILIFFPNTKGSIELRPFIDKGLERLEYCFSKIKVKYYQNKNGAYFDHLHSDQYAKFLFFVSREAYLHSNKSVYIKCSYLNKVLNGIDLYGHIKMPNIFLLVHPLGTILGRAAYSDYMIFYQGVTVGGKHENGDIYYPRFSEKTACFANSSIIGKVNSGGNTIFAANSSVVGGDFKSDSLVVGHYPDNVIKNNNKTIFNNIFYLQ